MAAWSRQLAGIAGAGQWSGGITATPFKPRRSPHLQQRAVMGEQPLRTGLHGQVGKHLVVGVGAAHVAGRWRHLQAAPVVEKSERLLLVG